MMPAPHPSPALSTRQGWLLCGLLFFATALSFLDRQVLSVLAPTITSELRMDNATYARVVFAFVLSYTAMFAMGGRLLDRLGTHLGLGLAVGIWSVANALHAFATGPWSLGVCRFLLGLGEGACFPAATKGAVEWSQPRSRSLAIGIANGGSAFGAVIAPPLTAWCASALGWRFAFVASGCCGLLWLMAWHLALPKPKIPDVRSETIPAVTFRALLVRADIRRLLFARFLFDPVFYFYMFWIPQYLARERNLSLTEIGAYTWIPFFALGISNIGAGKISDLLAARETNPSRARLKLMLFAAMVTPASGLAFLARTPALAITLMSLLLFAHGVWISNYVTLVSDTVEPAEVGTAVGLTGTAGGIAGMISSLTIGAVIDRFSFGPIFAASALLYPLAWVVLRSGRFEKSQSCPP